MTVLLGSSAVSWSDDFQKGLDAAKKEDYATALKEWTPLAEQGLAEAQFNLGLTYRLGRGVSQDYHTAVKWYLLSAEQGTYRAQNNLGLMYTKGDGVSQDYIRAHMWFNLAAAGGNKNGTESRDRVATNMTAEQIGKAQKMARECQARNYKDC